MSQYSSPKIWGPHFWFMLRCLANNYPLKPSDEDAQHIKTFFNELQYLLPCDLCKYTFKQHFAKYPLDKALDTKNSLIDWVEHIYQETKKVIQDKRIKILDVYEEMDEVKPIKIIYKSKIDPLEEQLNLIRKNVMSKENNINNNKAIAVPTTAQTNQIAKLNQQQLQQQQQYQRQLQLEQQRQMQEKKADKKVYKINKTHENVPAIQFDKISTGKRNEVDQTPKVEPIVIQTKLDENFGKVNSGKKLEITFTNQHKQHQTQPVMTTLQIVPTAQHTPISKPHYNDTPTLQIPPKPVQAPKQQAPPKSELPKHHAPKKPELPKQLQQISIHESKITSKPKPPVTTYMAALKSQPPAPKLELPKPQPVKIELPKPLALKLDIPKPQQASRPLKVPVHVMPEPSKALTPNNYIDRRQEDLARQLRYTPQQKFFPPKVGVRELTLTRKCKKCEH